MFSLKKLLSRRPRLVLTFLLAIFSSFLLPASWSGTSRFLVCWNIGVWSYLLLMGWLMSRAKSHRVKAMALQEDENAVTILSVISVAAMISLAAIVLELSGIKEMALQLRLLKYLLTGATVIGSWALLAVIFSFHYAMLYYQPGQASPVLQFPDSQLQPDYWDFLYFSFTIAVAAQTSDVAVSSRSARKTVLAQSVLSFFFNVAVLGFSINIAAGLVGN